MDAILTLLRTTGFAVLAMLACVVRADDQVGVSPGLLSLHARSHFNASNGGLLIEAMHDDWIAIAGTYRNSDYRTTHVVMAGATPWHVGPVALGGVGGVLDGMKRNDGHAIPVGFLVARWRPVNHVELSTLVLPVPNAACVAFSIAVLIP